ncbi:metal ABC transporter substrate-binding protein [Deinococcus sp. Leaf326]|uniref:metal ABC transporter substrate-binding protein n=1 Tax=Deinococcus sp. Leaf326 TaxID=1736338 RepID=UPI0006FE4EEF|nr:metal ABC transporter substrate-binding protein [Deinococcus sp. Leaf326]KQR18750.1 hypothetical protein ASF71_20100 [Deinococcus sp. Leaf326]
MTTAARIPVTVIAGFLGAGKTTLVNHLIRQTAARFHPRRMGVIVNEFGQTGVDGQLIERLAETPSDVSRLVMIGRDLNTDEERAAFARFSGEAVPSGDPLGACHPPVGPAVRGIPLLLALALSCADAQTPSVMVSFQPLYDVATRVAGTSARVERAVPVGASPHSYDPTVRDLVRLKSADLVFMAGLGADAWLEKYVAASGGRATTVRLGETLKFTPLRSGRAVDPHWWLDASLMAQAAQQMGAALAKADPNNALTYRQNADREAQRLNTLHAELRRTLAPVRGGQLVTFHNAFGYFARAYGLRVVATLAPLEGIEPSTQTMTQAVRTIRTSGVKAVFSEPQLPAGPARAVAAEAGVPLYVLDPEGSAQTPGYADMMRHNRDTLLRALK